MLRSCQRIRSWETVLICAYSHSADFLFSFIFLKGLKLLWQFNNDPTSSLKFLVFQRTFSNLFLYYFSVSDVNLAIDLFYLLLYWLTQLNFNYMPTFSSPDDFLMSLNCVLLSIFYQLYVWILVSFSSRFLALYPNKFLFRCLKKQSCKI